MKVLFISASCSKKKYQEVYQMRVKKLIDPQQKFCNLLINGMCNCNDVDMECLTAIPVSASTAQQKKFDEELEQVTSNLKYRYLGFKNGKISRYLTLYRNSRKAVNEWIKKNKGEQMIIVCDALSYFITRPAQKVAKRNGIKTVGIVTDLPLLSTNMKKRKESIIKKFGLSIFQHLTDKSLSCYDAYIPLTESINDYVNHSGKPMIIIEGSVDSEEIHDGGLHEKKSIMLYAGGVYEKYGIKNLVEAFIKSNTKGYLLHIYGEGSYVEELKKVSAKYPEIQYMGMVSLDEIVCREKEAMFLVNPRPSDEEFSKYSFPSKTLEYMVSGTPLLTTRLPGIPDEYFEYVYYFENEDIDSMADRISDVLSEPNSSVERKAHRAFDFVIKEKSNLIQGKKIVLFLDGLCS